MSGDGNVSVEDLDRADLGLIGWSGSASHVRNVAGQLDRRDAGTVDYLVIRDGEGIPVAKGAVDYEEVPDAGAIMQLATRQDLEGRGYARAIIREAERRIRDRGLDVAVLAVEPDNERARRLYEHLGYEPTGERETGWEYELEDGSVGWYSTTVVDMRKRLESADARPPDGSGERARMQIRPATVDDAVGVARVHVSAWQVAYRGQVPDSFLEGLSVEQRTTAWIGIIEETSWPERGLMVAEDDQGDIVGFAHVSASRDDDAEPGTGEVTAIYIAPEAWRAGIGRALLESASSSLRDAGFTRAALWVLDTNHRARQFYEHLGWRPDGAVKVDPRGAFSLNEYRYFKQLA